MKLREVVNKFKNEKAFFSAVKKELKKLAKEKTDFTYFSERGYNRNPSSGCNYDSGPDSAKSRCSGCIFGQALRSLGWTDKIERSHRGSIKDLLLTYASINECPKNWQKIQTDNDNNKPWGSFLKYLR